MSVSTSDHTSEAVCAISVSGLEDANVRPCGILQGDSLPLVEALTDRKDADDKEYLLQPNVVEFTQPDRKEESVVILPAEGSSLLDTSQPVAEFHPLSQADKSACVTAGQGLDESVDQSISKNLNTDGCNTESQPIPQVDVANNLIQDCGQEMDIDPAFLKTTAKACGGVKKSGASLWICELV